MDTKQGKTLIGEEVKDLTPAPNMTYKLSCSTHDQIRVHGLVLPAKSIDVTIYQLLKSISNSNYLLERISSFIYEIDSCFEAQNNINIKFDFETITVTAKLKTPDFEILVTRLT